MKSEAQIQQEIRLAAAQRGVPLMRNNSGAARDISGRLIRYGLGNDSEKINKVRKSSDLIGILPVHVTPEMVGQVHGLFFAVECKREGWRGVENDRDRAQLAFGEWVQKHGGIFTFATRIQDIWPG